MLFFADPAWVCTFSFVPDGIILKDESGTADMCAADLDSDQNWMLCGIGHEEADKPLVIGEAEMGIAFTPEQWRKVEQTYEAWWHNQLERPILPVWLEGRNPGRPCPEAPVLSQANCADLTIPAEALIDRLDYELSKYTYLGDAFPRINFDSFGPGLVAAFLGARLDNTTGRVWFHPETVQPIGEIEPVYDPDNIWLKRIRDIYAAGLARWGDQVLMGMPDLGGSLDILSTFRPSEALLLDLVDEPEAVERLNWACHELWHRFFSELSTQLRAGVNNRPGVRGWTDWGGVFSASPSYILQCDFCYMISPAMFEQFVKPELAASAKRLGRTVYHLDGIGQLPHLASLMEIPEIRAIQWVPGDGKPPQHEWLDVYRQIHAAGKGALVFCGPEGMARIAEEIGTTRGLCHMPMTIDATREADVRHWFGVWGIPSV